MRLKTVLAAAAALGLAAAPSAAVSSKGRQINAKDKIVVDPGTAYIFYRSTMKLNLMFLREVTPEDRKAWEAKRDEAFRRAEARYQRDLSQWQKQDEFYRTSSEVDRMHFARPVKPAPVARDTFAFSPPELDNFTPAGAGPRVDDADGPFDYLIAVEPGTYALYGPMVVGANGGVGTCLCMGSVKFEAVPGKIVDIGLIAFPRFESHDNAAMRLRGPKAMPVLQVTPASAALPLPPRLNGLPVVAADLHAAGKVPNYYGIEVDRLPAITGVLAYRRDRVIDVKSEGAAGQAEPAAR